MYENLFSPITINKTEIRNRTVYPSLGVLFSQDRRLNDRYYNYFHEKAKGGTGIVIVGPVGMDQLGSGFLTLSLTSDDKIPSFQKLTSLIRQEGAKSWIQLFHAGAYSHPMLINNETPIAPSAVYSKYTKTTPREMTIDEIQDLQESYVKAALRAQEAGFDGIEILASAGYLITQFLSPLKNQRTDAYGGSFENRIRFPREIIEKCREKLGSDFPLTIRIAGNDFVPGHNTDAETPAIAKVYEQAGVDAISVTGGWHETNVPQMTPNLPEGGFSFLAQNIKNAVSIPIMASNRIATPKAAEELIKEGYTDMVNLGRSLIADPHWTNKAREGKAAEIRPCVACLQGCMDGIMTGHPASCVGNPIAGFEGVRVITKSKAPKSVMVIGSGIGGLEAAVTAAQAGHQVDIYEKDSIIGGQLNIAGIPPHKGELFRFIDYYQTMIAKYKIPVHLNTEVNNEIIKGKNPEHLIIAEGAEPIIPPVKGMDDHTVISAWKVLRDNITLGKNVAIIGGGSVGLETALFAAMKGTLTPEALHFLFTYEAESVERLRELMFNGISKVTVFEMLPKVGKDIGKSTKWVVLGNLSRYGIKLKTHSKVLSIENGKITYEQEGEQKEEQFDDVILAAGSKAKKTLSNEIEKLGIPFTQVGDCIQPGKINHAIHGGFLAALEI